MSKSAIKQSVKSLQSTETSRESRKIGKDLKIGDQMTARIVTCAGDPGLTEPFFFDILSRFLIVVLEPCDVVPTNSNLLKRFALVKRPRPLWIDCPSTPDITPANKQGNMRRKDYLGNINIGSTANYTINTIPQLDTEYTIGETITIKKIPKEYATQSGLFVSQFANTDFSTYYNGPQWATSEVKAGGPDYEAFRKSEDGIGGNPLNETMDWSPAYWTSHGSGLKQSDLLEIDKHGRNRGPHWLKLKPLYTAGKTYAHPVKPTRGHESGYEVPGEKVEKLNAKGAIQSINDRLTGTITENNYWMILHYYLVDSFLQESYPQYATTVKELALGAHRYQQPNGLAVNRQTRKGVYSENLFPNATESSEVHHIKNSLGGSTPVLVSKRDNSYLNLNLLFTFCEFEDTNTGNKQRNTRDECMPLVIASPNNFPTPKERKLGSILYEPAYAKVVAAQNP